MIRSGVCFIVYEGIIEHRSCKTEYSRRSNTRSYGLVLLAVEKVSAVHVGKETKQNVCISRISGAPIAGDCNAASRQ